MISNFWFIGDHADFYTSRSGRIGASDIPALFQNPENFSESLAGYGRTALTVYQEKIGELEREPAGLPAEMGHFLENKALELFIRRFVSFEYASTFRANKEEWERSVQTGVYSNGQRAKDYNHGKFKHNVQYYTEGMIAHPDCLYIGDESLKGKKERFKTVEGIRVDLSKPFLIEAKSARLMSAKRPEGSFVRGYDKKFKGWQGIPLKHYMQIQFQLALFQIDTAYLALISDTSDFHIWQIKANRKDQNQIMDRVGYIVKCIQTKTLPKRYVINTDDVQACFPKLNDDYITISGKDQEEAIIKAAETVKEAKRQQEIWKDREKDGKAALAVSMRDFKELRVGAGKVCQWKNGGTGEGLICSFTVLQRDYPSVYKYLEKKGMIKPAKIYRYVDVKWKGDEEWK